LKPAFVFGFAAWTPTQIRESLLKLASALKNNGRNPKDETRKSDN
jgi:hypothetical protein